MKNHPWATGIFVFFVLLGWGARQAIGGIYSLGEAIQLVETLASSGLYLGAASATSSATILALMLTITGMMRRLDADFDYDVWWRINLVAKAATVSLMASLLLLLALVFPVGEFEGLPADWFIWMYNGLFAITVLVVALLATTVALLYATIHDVIATMTPDIDASAESGGEESSDE